MANPAPTPAVLNDPLQVTNSPSPAEAPSAPQNDFSSVYVASDAICLQAYQELTTKAPNTFVQSPVLLPPQGMGIGHLFAVAVTRDALEQAKKIITSPGMQNILEPTSIFNPRRLSINDTSGNRFPLLRWAALNASVEVLRCMFTPRSADQKVFDVNFVDWFGVTPLECALQLQAPSQVPKIEYLLDHPEIQSSIVRPLALQYAIQFCRIGSGLGESVVQKFLEKGANVDLTGCYYGTYFEAACFFSSSVLINKLISKSTSKVTSLNSGGAKYGSILQAAACLGRLDVVQHLLALDEVDVNQTGGVYGSPLAAAAKAWYRDVRDPYTTDPNTKDLWGSFIRINRPEDMPQTHLEILKAMINRGATVAKGEGMGIFHSSVGAAVYSLSPPIMELLLQNDNASGTETQRRHSEALVAAAFMQESANVSSILELLITLGHGNPNHCSHWMTGFYPLELAVLIRNFAHVRYLLEKGADPHLEGSLGGALRVAISMTPQHGSAIASATVKLILSHMNLKSSNLTARDSQYCNILHMAVFYGLIDVVHTLLANDVRCDVKDLGQRTVLHIATLQGSTTMIKLLLESGRLDDELIEAEDAWGRTASQIVEEENRKAREVAEKSRSVPISDFLYNHQVSQNAMQWSEIRRIMKPLEDKALADQELLHNRGVRFLGPRANVLPRLRSASAKPVTTILPRGSGLGFQATIVDFSIDDKWACEAHQIRHPLIDEILYSSSPRDIMARENPLTAPASQVNTLLLSSTAPTQAAQSQALPQLPSTESAGYVDPQFRWIHLPTNNMAWVEVSSSLDCWKYYRLHWYDAQDLVNNIRQRQQNPAPAISRELWGVDLQSTSPGSAPHTYSITPQCKLLNAGM
ncbi:ankyrin [Cadophora sp. DSE1049]|nr:ankyrin [Cadophora sp. DSE1049]